MKWLRLWTDIIDDPKLRRLTDVEFRHFVFLLALCAECEDGGAISMDDSDICWRLRIAPEKFNETKAKLESLGIIEVRDNSIRFVNWEKRQPAKDDSIERVRRFRERAKQNKKHSDQNSETDAKNNVTEIKPGCNEAVTEVKRSCNGAVTLIDTETEQNRDRTETETYTPPLPPEGEECAKKKSRTLLTKTQQQRFDLFYAAYPKKKSRMDAEKAFLSVNPDDQLLGEILTGLENSKRSADWRKDGGRYIPYPATWLRAAGWEDEVTIESMRMPNGTITGSARMDSNIAACQAFIRGD